MWGFRAVCGRVETTLQGLPPPYKLNRPQMLLITSAESRQPVKAPSFSVIWMNSFNKPEIVNTTNGKPENGVSKVCKQQFLLRFYNLFSKISKVSGVESFPSTYAEIKQAVINYNVIYRLFWSFTNAKRFFSVV